jgi:hypothetical protein
MTLLADSARNILREAIVSELGIVVRVQPTSDMIAPALRAKQVLYRFRQEDSDFATLQIVLSPTDPDREIWIIKKD